MDRTLLKQLQANNIECLADLNEYEKELRSLKTEILTLRKDTVLTKLFTQPSMRVIFKEQFAELKEKSKLMDSLLKATTTRSLIIAHIFETLEEKDIEII
jgi:hypothetical protein